jgi:uncharacterized OB-fold protein
MTEKNQEVKIKICLMCEKSESDGRKFQPSRKYCTTCNSKRSNEMVLNKNSDYFQVYMKENWRKYHKPKSIPLELQKRKGRPKKDGNLILLI